MSGQNPPFFQAASFLLATSTTSTVTSFAGGMGDAVIATNLSTGNLYVQFDAVGAPIVAGQGYLVLPNSQRVFMISKSATKIGVILDAGTGHAYIEVGNGAAR